MYNYLKKRCKLLFGQPNTHVINGKTGDKIQKIIKAAEQENGENIIMTVPFDKQTLTWKTDSDNKK